MMTSSVNFLFNFLLQQILPTVMLSENFSSKLFFSLVIITNGKSLNRFENFLNF